MLHWGAGWRFGFGSLGFKFGFCDVLSFRDRLRSLPPLHHWLPSTPLLRQRGLSFQAFGGSPLSAHAALLASGARASTLLLPPDPYHSLSFLRLCELPFSATLTPAQQLFGCVAYGVSMRRLGNGSVAATESSRLVGVAADLAVLFPFEPLALS